MRCIYKSPKDSGWTT